MDKEVENFNDQIVKLPSRKKKKSVNETSEAKHRYIYSRKDVNDPVAILIDELLLKCNQKDYGTTVDFSSLVAYSIKLLKEADIIEIQNSTLSDEDRANEELRKFNAKNGTNYTLFEFVLSGLGKKFKKSMNQWK